MSCSSRAPPTLVVLAAGLATRYGGLKQLAPVGPSGEALVDYAVYDARRAGFGRVVYVIRREIEADFRRHVDRVVGDALPVTYVFQDIPRGRKPWGAAHALLAARHELHGSFAVANADDFYGADAYALLHDHLTGPGPLAASAPEPIHALAGYRLDETLSPHGGVSRAVCAVADDYVVGLEEMSHVHREGDAIVGIDEAGARRTLDGAAVVSTNLWGFAPDVLPTLERQVGEFVEAAAAEPDTELPLSTALAQQIRSGAARGVLLRPAERCFGMTFQEDVPAVRKAIADLVRAGAYPAELRVRD